MRTPYKRLSAEERERIRYLYVECGMWIGAVAVETGRSFGAIERLVRGLRPRRARTPDLERAREVVDAFDKAKAAGDPYDRLVRHYGYANQQSLSNAVSRYRRLLAAHAPTPEEQA